MPNVGKFGKPPIPTDDDPLTFDYFDVELRVNPLLTDLALVSLFTAMQTEDVAERLAAVRSIGSTLVHPDDLERFWGLVEANRQTMSDLADFAAELISVVTARPTERPSDSSVGPSSTDPSSPDDSSLAAAIEDTPPGPAADVVRLAKTRDLAMAELEGRPDLQVAALRAAGLAG